MAKKRGERRPLTSGAAFSFLIFLAYMMVGAYLVRKSSDRKEGMVVAQVAFGCIYLLVSLVYLFTGLQQVFHETGHHLADRAFALFSMYAAFSVTIPASYFCTYIIRGDHRYAWNIMALFVGVTCAGIGMTSSTIMYPRCFTWGSTWDFSSAALHLFIVAACCIPALIAVVMFIQLVFQRLESRRARYRLILITLSFIFIVSGWVVMPTDSELVVLASRLMLLLGALSALLAYYSPSSWLRTRIRTG